MFGFRSRDTGPCTPPESASPAPRRSATPAAPRPCPGAPLFDAEWYAARVPDAGTDPWAHYAASGSVAARSPAPLFSPAWYRAAYPDVSLSGVEPLVHWLANGWREGRDPCPLVSTRALVEAAPGSDAEGRDPLGWYLAEGRPAGVRPHPAVAPFDPDAAHVAVVTVYRGDASALDLVIWALENTGGRVGIELWLVDVADNTDRGALDRLATTRGGGRLSLRRLTEPRGSTEAACAAAGLAAALAEGRTTHAALLDQATLLPAGFLDDLVDLWLPAVGPTLNLARTAQAVPIDFDIYESREPLDAVADFAGRRRQLIPGALDLCAPLEPACLLFHRAALEDGALCEIGGDLAGLVQRIGSRLAGRGLGGPAIARHLYAHRLERSPVSGGPPRPGIADPSPANAEAALGALAGAEADRRALKGWSADAPRLLAAHAARREAAEKFLRETGAAARNRMTGEPGPGGLWPGDTISAGDPPRPPRTGDSLAYRRAYRRARSAVWSVLVDRDLAKFDAFLATQPLTAVLAAIMATAAPVLVLTMDTDPVTGDEKDGYVQRVVAIDKALADQTRIYLKIVAARRNRPALAMLADGIWRLEVAHDCKLGEGLVEAVLRMGTAVYSQSLVGIDPPMVRRLLPRRTGVFLMDMHGAVPEEFEMYGDHYMARKYARYEAIAAAQADHVVCVTGAMADHFEAKLGIDPSQLVVCPIYMHSGTDEATERDYNARPRAVYAGGTQRWQMIPELARLVADTAGDIDWTLFTPDPEGMARALARAGADPAEDGIGLRAASQREVFAAYRHCDFGLLLRADSVVNRVACPTKLIEYLRFGIVPVLDFPLVGDFVAFGMRYIAIEDFRAGRLPDPDGRADLAEANRAVFARLLAASQSGLGQIARIVSGAAHPVGQNAPLVRSMA